MPSKPLRPAPVGSRPGSNLAWRIGSTLVMGATAAMSRAFLVAFNRVEVLGLPNFLAVLDARRSAQQRKRGLITVSNHVSVLDDPLVWGVLPLRYSLDPYNHRWGLGAHDLLFSSRLLSTFFSLGQVLPTHRNFHSPCGGLFQPTMDQAVKLLSAQPFTPSFLGQPEPLLVNAHFTTNGRDLFPAPSRDPRRNHSWIHVFPEGFVHQHHQLQMRYFKWGVSRLILEAEPGPEFVPMFIDGTQHIMPEDRKFPRLIPRVGNRLTVGFGEAIDTGTAFADVRERWKNLVLKHLADTKITRASTSVTVGDLDGLPCALKYGPEATALRINTARRVRDEVATVRLRLGFPSEDPKFGLAEAWARQGRKPL